MAVWAFGLLGIVLGMAYQARLSSPATPAPENVGDAASPASDSATAVIAPARVRQPTLPPDPNALPGERVLRFKNATDYQHFLDEAEKRGLSILGVIPGLRAVRVGAVSDVVLSKLLQGLDAAQIGENYRVTIPPLPSNLTPNGQTPLAAFGPDWIKAMGVNGVDPTWGRGVKVAVIDSGIDPSSNLAGTSLQSIDLTHSTTGATDSSFSHGTAVASLIAGGDSQTAGLAPGSSLLSVRVLNANGEGDAFTVANGIVSAVDAGSQIINLSLGSYGDSPVLRDAVDYALSRGVAVVAAAGNDGVGQVSYPAGYPGVLAVGSVDATLQPAYFSNYGSPLGILAPGVGLPAGQAGDQVVSFSGTSASTATVSAGLAALLSSDHSLTPVQGANLLTTYADDQGLPGRDDQSGYGTIDLNRVLQRNTPNIVDGAVASQIILTQGTANQPITVGVTVQNRGTAAIGDGILTVQVAGVPSNFTVQNLAPNQSVMETVQVSPYQLTNGAVVIRSQLSLPNITDATPANNVVQGRLRLTSPSGK